MPEFDGDARLAKGVAFNEPLVVAVEGRSPVTVPNFMPDELWQSTKDVISERYAANIGANVPGGKLTDDTLVVEHLKVESSEVFTLAGALLQYWWQPQNVALIGRKVSLPDAFVEVTRRITHIRDAYNLTMLGDMEVGLAWIKDRIKKINAAGGFVDERQLSDLEF